jgi:Bifunctional DNA primase/polymerase, N-terminal/Primase C terminal 1 (PriCT-1)
MSSAAPPSANHHAALKIARRGKPVFPCRPDKAPYTARGFKAATTNPGLVNAFWNRYRDALIGMPTGKRSGVFVVDVDRLEALRELPQELPETLTVRTPSGGVHLYFKHVSGLTNTSGGLPDGIDIRAEGGYVIVPPSEGYSVKRRAAISDAPEWLLEILREKSAREPTRPGPGVKVDIETGPIPEGGRNNTLASIAGRLRACGFERDGIEDALLRINAERCTPPLGEAEVRKIAASVARYVPGQAGPDEETLAALEAIEHSFWRAEWAGMGGKSERSVVAVLIKAARRHGRLIPGGVEISIDHRTLALAAATSRRTVGKVLKRSEWLVSGQAGSGTKSGSIVIRTRAKVPHSYHQGYMEQEKSASGETLRAPRLRWSAPGIRRLGKSCEAAVDYLDRTGGVMTIAELAAAMGISRAWDFRRRVVSRLVAAGVVECSGNVVSLVEEWLEALNEERENTGEIAALRRDIARYDRERVAYAKRHEDRPEHAPTHEELAALERARRARRMRLALKALRTRGSGPAKNLELFMSGELHDVDYLVWSILHFHHVPAEMLDLWRSPVLEAGSVVVSEVSTPGGMPHRLDCACEDCVYPEPRYARPYQGLGPGRQGGGMVKRSGVRAPEAAPSL